jgi:NAD(P)-dependent dehydrogenase (short-subunit alcohol dehydrogenase family)
MRAEELLAGQVAVVTGGARGIGRACVEGLGRAGAGVVILDRLVKESEEAVRAIRDLGGRAVAVGVDLSKTQDIVRAVADAAEAFGQIDILINNAGIYSEVPTSELTEDQWDRVMAVNLKAMVFLSQAVLPWMERRGRGAIVNVSSLAARIGGIMTGVDYTASKAGVVGLTRALARQFGPKGIRVNAVAPGPIGTEMIRHWSEEVRQSFVSRIPLGRLGTPEDVARVVVFLAGPGAGYVTGATIDVNGGFYMG